ncbi:hypothetical protein lacNasYZ03_11270 [Lactobacillus nasalidis]|uniref:Uncharacterized protein n=1 Tax=Lactobacillus nasalidis TaxID=2797258 RepID=A0ABQ3W7V8_9LACO|nr:hypothetical protein [Lactobacillus nasalidis]GHV97850.1 hypothetical protein lacNasYZ01_10320 [Lactobacillus nasalidis]GHW00080.1 hypothetical protein lacNasYZ02_15090 [Lactobacillus nasalidis]GHW01440.1 hypothetical protein lacNasYZ03_11270 [Lactobacillus nasalidis]
MDDKKTTPTKKTENTEKKEPKFWKGDTASAFAYAITIGFFVGAANMIFLHWGWHPGTVSMILTFLIVGTNPAFADKRTPEQRKADADKAMQRIHEERLQKEAKAAKTQAQADKMDMQLKKNQLKIQKQQIKDMKHSIKCPHCHSHNVKPIGVHRKDFSLSREIMWGYGSGSNGKATKKTDFVCMKCGKRFVR